MADVLMDILWAIWQVALYGVLLFFILPAVAYVVVRASAFAWRSGNRYFDETEAKRRER